MKWQVKPKTEPNTGDWRVKVRFAWFPIRTTMPDKETVLWLERYKTNDKFTYNGMYPAGWYTHQIADMDYWKGE